MHYDWLSHSREKNVQQAFPFAVFGFYCFSRKLNSEGYHSIVCFFSLLKIQFSYLSFLTDFL